jgi:hypothetical protein
MKFLKITGVIALAFIALYLAGPKPSKPHYTNDLPTLPTDAVELEQYVADQEAKHKLKPDNQARIVWYNDSSKSITEYAVVYLHGFSASQEEGDPVHIDFAKKIGANLYLSRLDAHGLDTSHPLASFTAEGIWNSAKEAYAIGKKIGKKVILMSTSPSTTRKPGCSIIHGESRSQKPSSENSERSLTPQKPMPSIGIVAM